MADSVDRVFSHALSTVNKIRTGAEKPPAATRLKLYGLYKQSMEGDVEGIMERPAGKDESSKRAREKWDAWKSSSGLSRTEAKRRYISTLIETMRKYASPSPDARELVSELEFVWDQVKSNVPSSSSSSPLHTHGGVGLVAIDPPQYPSLDMKMTQSQSENKIRKGELPITVMSPVSQSQEEQAEAEEREEFVDAPDSQIAEELPPNEGSLASKAGPTTAEPPGTPSKKPSVPGSPNKDPRWRRRMESALVRMTAEVAALREQLEQRRLFAHSRRYRFVKFIGSVVWFVIKHIAVDVVILGIFLLWMRRKKDTRLEGATRVLLGDAVAQVQRVGEKQVAALKMQLGGKSKAN